MPTRRICRESSAFSPAELRRRSCAAASPMTAASWTDREVTNLQDSAFALTETGPCYRNRGAPMPVTKTEIFPYIFYRDVPAALEWLTRAFGFKEETRTTPPDGGMHAEMSLGDQRIMMGESATATMGVFVYLDDVDGHHARARAAGAEIVNAPHDEPWGRTYSARDLDGHP